MSTGKTITASITTASLLATILIPITSASAGVQDLSPEATLSWTVLESYGSDLSWVVISVPDKSRTAARGTEYWKDAAYCSEIGPGKRSIILAPASCDPADYRGKILVQYSVLMAPVCNQANRDCISEVFATGADGKKIRGQFLRYTGTSKFEIPANKSIGNPAGASSAIWKIPGVINLLGTDLYEVHLNMEGGLVEFRDGRLINKFRLQDRTFNTQIRPVASESDRANNEPNNSMPSDYSFGISAILPDSIMTWYSGRVEDADVNYKKLSSGYNEITITGKPISIPIFTPSIKKGAATKELLDIYHFCRPGESSCDGYYTQGMGAQNFLEPWRPLMGDKASASRTVWAMRSVQPNFTGSPNAPNYFACARRDRLAGISTTNAMLHSGALPKYKNGFFSYEVSGLHYEPDGVTEFQGHYEMSMNEELARCMFGFPKAPLYASVSVRNKSGTKSIATVTTGVRDGKLRLTASNFTFSRKVIRMQVSAKGFVSCVRGDTVRHVKGTRCPGGFKKAK
jgi:hypothetical protein